MIRNSPLVMTDDLAWGVRRTDNGAAKTTTWWEREDRKTAEGDVLYRRHLSSREVPAATRATMLSRLKEAGLPYGPNVFHVEARHATGKAIRYQRGISTWIPDRLAIRFAPAAAAPAACSKPEATAPATAPAKATAPAPAGPLPKGS